MIILGPVMVLVVVWCSCCVASLSLLAKISFFSLLRRSTELRANYFWILFLGIFVSVEDVRIRKSVLEDVQDTGYCVWKFFFFSLLDWAWLPTTIS